MAQTAQLRRIDRAENEAQRVFRLQREAYLKHPYPSLEERRRAPPRRRARPDRQPRRDRGGDPPGLRPPGGGRVPDARALHVRRRHPPHAEEAPALDAPAAAQRVRPLRDRKEPGDSAAEGRRRHRRPLELPALPDHQPADERPRRREPRHDQDGERLPDALPAAPREALRGPARRGRGDPARRARVRLLDAALRSPGLHRLGGRRPDRDALRRREPDARHARARREVPDHRVRRLRPRRGRLAHPLREVRERRPDLPRAGLPLPARGLDGALRGRRPAHPARALPAPEGAELHLDHRREVVPAAPGDARRTRRRRGPPSSRSSRARTSTTSSARSRPTSCSA